jgi:hypothetical protein
MRKVQALIDRANGTNFPAERDSCIAKADSLMAAYAIEQFELDFAKPAGSRVKPEVRDFNDRFNSADAYKVPWEIRNELSGMFYSLVRHVGCMSSGWKVVGYASDLDWLDWLFTSIQLHMVQTMEPTPSTDLSLDENIVLLKETGLKWEEVHRRLVKAGVMPDKPWGRGIGTMFTKTYTRYCEENGRDRNYASPGVYRRSFVEGYVYRVKMRLQEMAQARGDQAKGHELVIANKEKDLKDFFYEVFPNLKPHPQGCDCEIHHRCSSPGCTRPACVARRKPIKYRAPRYVDPKIDHGAMRNGQRAANTADLMGGRRNVTPNKREVEG